jgi:hypothetical protein
MNGKAPGLVLRGLFSLAGKGGAVLDSGAELRQMSGS